MADPEHLKILKKGVNAWNEWREKIPRIKPDLRKVVIDEWELDGANLIEANLSQANLHQASLGGADLHMASLGGANLSQANLSQANLQWANLHEANLHGANLGMASLSEANLHGANLSEARLCQADLHMANLHKANLQWANLVAADLRRANLSEANLHKAHLQEANLHGANLHEAHLQEALLHGANLGKALLAGADLERAVLDETIFSNVNLASVKGLDKCTHFGPCILDHRTLMKSGKLPLSFLRNCGIPDSLIEYLPSLLNSSPIQFYSCFISYSSKDQEFADRLYADLQTNGVRCWFAPEDLKIGDKFRQRIDESIRVYDKLMVILSKQSLQSEWVEDEVETAIEKEKKSKTTVLFPIRIDDAVVESDQAWAAKIRRTRHIGDFSNWKNHDAYKQSFDHLLHDLKESEEKS